MKVKKNQILSHLKKPVTVRMKQAAAIQTWKTEGLFITFTVVSKLCVSLQSVYRVFLVILYFLFRRPFPQPHAALHFRSAFLHGHPAVRLFFFWLHFDLQLHVCLKRSKKQGEIVKPKRVPSNSFVTNKKLLNSPPFAESPERV